jgi:hypothetical protein
MKKFLFSFCPPLVGLLTFGLFARFIASVYQQISWLRDTYWLVHLILPLLVMGGAVALHWTAKGRTGMYLLSYLCNAIGSGCLLGAIYGLRDYVPHVHLLAALVPAFLIGTATFLIFLFSREPGKGIVAFSLAGLALILVVAGIIIWIFYSMPVGCCFLFSGLFILPFPIAVGAVQADCSQQFRYLSFSGFGTFILVFLVAAFILSEGEILEGFDIGEPDAFGKKKGK